MGQVALRTASNPQAALQMASLILCQPTWRSVMGQAALRTASNPEAKLQIALLEALSAMAEEMG